MAQIAELICIQLSLLSISHTNKGSSKYEAGWQRDPYLESHNGD